MHVSFAITKTLINVRLNMVVFGNAYYWIIALGYLYILTIHLRIDDLEDEIIREKMKINALSNQLDDTFNEMLSKY